MAAQASSSKLLPPWGPMLCLPRLHWACPWKGTREQISLEGGLLSVGSTVQYFSCQLCWHITGVAQVREKQARESSTCWHRLQHLYHNMLDHSITFHLILAIWLLLTSILTTLDQQPCDVGGKYSPPARASSLALSSSLGWRIFQDVKVSEEMSSADDNFSMSMWLLSGL